LAELPARLEEKIERTDGCWLWAAHKGGHERAYGYVFWDGKKRRAHRVIYELFVGPIPGGLTIDHLCRNPACVNPAHLEAVTMRENLMRGNTLQAENARKTRCLRGHDLSGTNLRIDHRGARQCRACDTVRTRVWRARQKVAYARA
jgi:hypothetical protein